ncbi:MAG TPA: MFS transporter [Allosphingosinicella sp.]|nr:MFS transporter [Allosphingosinicella sp.]
MTSAPPPFARAMPRLLALALAVGIGFTLMGSFSTVQEGAKAQMGLSDVQLSLIQGVSIAIPLLLLSIPIGIAVDRVNRVRLLILLSLLGITGTLGTAFAPSVETLFAARMLTAIGTTGGLTAALSLTADLCATAARGRGTLIVSLGQRLGIAAGFGLVGWLFGRIGQGAAENLLGAMSPWRGAHLILAVLAAILVVPLLFLREPARHEMEAGPRAAFRVVLGELWQRRRFLGPLFAGQVSVVMADAAGGIWAVPVLSRNYGVGPDEVAGWMGLMIFLAGLGGAILGGISADLGQKSGRPGGLLLGAVIAAALGIPAALFPLSPNLPVFAAAIGLLLLCGTLTGLIVAVSLTVFLPNELRGLSIGVFIAIAGLIGYGLAPTAVAGVSKLLGGEAQLAPALAIVGVATSALAFVAFLAAMRRCPPTNFHD